jgi:hypothetical protein
VDADTFGVRDWTLTGVPNPLDITGGRRTVVFTAKIPDHRGLFLSNDVSVDISKEAFVIQRMGSGLSMKIQAKDCANGGVFQMEPARADGATTRFTHVLPTGGSAVSGPTSKSVTILDRFPTARMRARCSTRPLRITKRS